ncbi:RNI-like protein [Mycena olivaceomarginata]|nr:RNI-like protein [Mycena olivaceomarginata]
MASNVRGPMSALTDFLRSTGITPTTIARRVATQQQNQPEAGPSNAPARRSTAQDVDEGYASDNLDEPDSPPKKQKVSKAAAAKAKANKKKKKKDDEDSDEDAYTALSKSMGMSSTPKPAVGSFAECATCGKQFTVTKYTMASSSDPGFLCHPCAKAGGNDPFKKPAAPRKRKTPAEAHCRPYRGTQLPDACVIARHIDDVEAFGDIGALNMDAISKALSKNRSLNSENATLFYGAENTKLALYDATNLAPDGFSTLGHLNPNLTSLRLDFCGPLNDTVMASWNNSFPNLVSLELLGPFLVREAAWTAFLKSHPNLEAFLITKPAILSRLPHHAHRQLENDPPPSRSARAVRLATDDAAIALLAAVGANLTHLDLSGHSALTDDFLAHGIDTHMHTLASLALTHLPELTDAGLAAFFGTFEGPASSASTSRATPSSARTPSRRSSRTRAWRCRS